MYIIKSINKNARFPFDIFKLLWYSVSSCSFLFPVNMSLICIASRIQCTCLDNYLLQGILHLLETKHILWTFAIFRVFEFRNSHCHSVPVTISINHDFVYKFVNQVKFYADRFRFKT